MRENNPARRVLFSIGVAALIAVIVLVFLLERHKKRDYQQMVSDAARQETELTLVSAVATGSETEKGDPVQTEEKEAGGEPETEKSTETHTEKVSEAETKASAIAAETETEATQAPVEEETSATAEDISQTAEEETQQETTVETEYVNPARPVLKLKQKKMTIKAGDEFEPLLYVDSITDDNDNMWDLWRNIQIDGEYDTEKAGEYSITYLVVDSDGYGCVPQTLKLIVKK